MNSLPVVPNALVAARPQRQAASIRWEIIDVGRDLQSPERVIQRFGMSAAIVLDVWWAVRKGAVETTGPLSSHPDLSLIHI